MRVSLNDAPFTQKKVTGQACFISAGPDVSLLQVHVLFLCQLGKTPDSIRKTA